MRLRRAGDDETPEDRRRHLEDRIHVFEGLMAVVDDPRAYLEVVLAATDTDDAIGRIRAAYGLTELQAHASLDMQLRRLNQEWLRRLRDDLAEMRTLPDELDA